MKGFLLASLLFVAGNAQSISNNDDWTLGNFTKVDSVNPIMGPNNMTMFFCPVRGQYLQWEEKDVFNPTALVRDGKVHLLYRAEDEVRAYAGTSRIGLATSEDGLHFNRETLPIFYPKNDSALEYEWEGGCEDPRIVEDDNGTYYMTYTGFNGSLARLMVATSRDLRTWQKHGLAFKRLPDLWSKSGSIVTTVQGDRFVAEKIQGQYWMYWGESNIYVATSSDLVDWTLVTNENGDLFSVFGPRPGKFDSDIVEPGPQAFIKDDGIILIYNSRNKAPDQGGDPDLPVGTYSAGQVLINKTMPTQLLRRTDDYFITPDRDYEIIGQVNNVVFVEGLVRFRNKWFLYYRTANSKIAVATIN